MTPVTERRNWGVLEHCALWSVQTDFLVSSLMVTGLKNRYMPTTGPGGREHDHVTKEIRHLRPTRRGDMIQPSLLKGHVQ
jgi:hypothetical protein